MRFSSSAANATYNFENCTFHNIEVQRDGFVGDRTANFGIGSETANITLTSCLFYDLIGFGGRTPSIFNINVTGTSLVLHSIIVHADIQFGYIINTGTGRDLEMKNNIFFNNSGASFAHTFGSPTVVSNNNCYFENFTFIQSGIDDVFLDPLFIDPAFQDYRLRTTSPCIGAGSLI